jgi:N-acetylmuramoyl-L-alanine amidase
MNHAIDHAHTSPNKSSRKGAHIRMLVLHATVGSYNSALGWLTSPASRVSTHYLIRAGDGKIAQLVDDDEAAWHAGDSFWLGLDSDDIQHCSIGIELENMNTGRDPYPQVQIDSARWLCQRLIGQYEIERVYVVRHLDIAVPHGRKTDPAGFPWSQFVDSLYAAPPPPPTPASPAASYRVRAGVTAGATIRAAARRSAANRGTLRAGDRWVGTPVRGELVSLEGFQTSDIWICDAASRCVWSSLLEVVL